MIELLIFTLSSVKTVSNTTEDPSSMGILWWEIDQNIQTKERRKQNMTQNQIAWLNYLENVRSHQAVEGETYRSNRAREIQGDIGLAQDLRRTLSQERTSLLGIQEQRRHHMADEAIHRMDVGERARAARAREFLDRRKQDQDLWVARSKLADATAERRLRDRQHVEKYSLDEKEYRRRAARDRWERKSQTLSNVGRVISSVGNIGGLIAKII